MHMHCTIYNTSILKQPPLVALRSLLRPRRHVVVRTASSGLGDSATSMWPWRRRTVAEMLRFMAPALVLPLADPLMSLIDTICIGQYAATLELASLGPSTFIFAFFSYIFNALGIATIACVAADLKNDDKARASRTASAALSIALVCGFLSTVVIQAFGAQIIAATGAALELRGPALAYLRIRAFAQPALLVCIVAQSALMAQRDSVTPSASVAVQVVTNLFLDVVFICGLGWGVAGAAWGTVAAQYLGAAILVARLQQRRTVMLSVGVPAAHDLRALWTTLAPLSVMYVAKNLCYLCIQLSAATLAPLQLAGHQAVWAMFNISAFTNATVEQAGLAFHPLARTGREVQETVKILMAMGIANGAFLGASTFAIVRLVPHVFSADPGVAPFMQIAAPFATVATLLVGADVAASASLVALGSARSLARSFAVCLAVLAPYMAAVVMKGWGLVGVWSGLVMFFCLRCAQSLYALSSLSIWRERYGDGAMQV